MQMQIPKQKVRVNIKTESFIVKGTVHTMVDSRLSDYITSQKDKFIPVTNAEVYYLGESRKVIGEKKFKREVVFINVDNIEMIEYL